MKKIRIKQTSFSDNVYHVFLGNNTRFEFTSFKKATNFLNKTSKFLTKQLHKINIEYSKTFNIYRQCWTYFEHDKSTLKSSIYQDNRTINNNLIAVGELLDKAHLKSSQVNGNYQSFQFLTVSVNYLINSLLLIKSRIKSKSIVSQIIEIDHTIEILLKIKSDIQNYSIDKAAEIIENQRHVSINSVSSKHLRIVNN